MRLCYIKLYLSFALASLSVAELLIRRSTNGRMAKHLLSDQPFLKPLQVHQKLGYKKDFETNNILNLIPRYLYQNRGQREFYSEKI